MGSTDAALTVSTGPAAIGRQHNRIAGPPVKVGEAIAVRF